MLLIAIAAACGGALAGTNGIGIAAAFALYLILNL